MVARAVVEGARSYLKLVNENGVPVSFGVLFGSQVKGTAGENSDIDLVVVSPRFDKRREYADVSKLWRLTARSDHRIEPIAVGEREWREDDTRAIVIIARREGEVIEP